MSNHQDYPTEVNRWDVFEISLEGPAQGNPFLEQRLQGIFTGKNESVVTEGFYDGKGIYRIRFMPSFSGRYSFILKGSFLETTLSGRFVVNEAEAGNHGPVRTANTYHFSYEDGTAFHPVGTIAQGWHLKYDGDIAQSLQTLKSSGFNKVRFSIFPYHDEFNLDDPQYFPYEGTAMSTHVLTKENYKEYTGSSENNHFQYSRFNTEYFGHLETCIQELGKAGIEADLVLFHPYDRWGFDTMSEAENDQYLSYVMNRLAGYHNIWWSLADGWDADQNKSLQDWEHYADLLVRKDPYHHLRSIHNAREIYDCTRPWISHASIHIDDLYRSAEYVNAYRIRFHKPIIMDDLGSEGNLPYGWGSLSPEEMTRRFWETAVRGGYPGHSETYLKDPEHIWSMHGGALNGESWKRAVFLKQILNEVPGNGLAPVSGMDDCCEAVPEAEYCEPIKTQYLYYFGFLRPSYREFYIDDDTDYTAEIIDTYAMTIHRCGIFHGHFKIELPLQPYLAIRLRRATAEDYAYKEPEPIAEEQPKEAEPADTIQETEEIHETDELNHTEEMPLPQEEQTVEPAEEPAEETEPQEEAVPEADAFAETVQLPIEKDPEEVPADAEQDDPSASIKDELMDGAAEEDLDFSSVPEFLADDISAETEKTNSEEIEKEETAAEEEIAEDEDESEEDDELPEIVTGSYLAMHKDENTLKIPPIHFEKEDK